MSDDMSADFGLDVTADEAPDSASATQINDEIFNGNNGASAEQVTDEIFGDQSGSGGGSDSEPTFADNSTSSSEPDASTIFADSEPAESAPAGINANFSGTEFYAGEATFDSNGDGVADTAVQDHGNQVEYYVDNNGDGQADELTITDANGQLISHTQLVDGTSATWQETAAPDVASGDVSVSDNVGQSGYVDPSSPAPAPASAYASSDLAQAGADSASADSGSTESGTTGTSDSADAIPPVDSSGPGADSAADGQEPADTPQSGPGSDYVAGGDLSLTIDGQTYDVGAPTLDFSGDGVADTVAVEQDGNVEYYVDSDQDGVADQIIVLDEANGALINHEVYDPSTGTWDNVTDESK
ncbi:hypothetical protein CLV47_11138 [Antricoccus suffuscus]|uniref:DUF6802 domain-containing protein n=1 Tax=Antricoccus suffuscus TaxID=1629062 RepID=A0A2T0ZXS7_9ACTN|nr:DUF6802 family protein [Antricoccus suffuscus]PRZ41162.1 hypothetical protein CLV47_11138 [Antricoccus suffuscus]